jgi:hypothetical protein
MKYLKTDEKGVKCQMTKIGFVPCDDLATLDALINATDCAYSANSEIWDAMREATRVLKAVAEKINGTEDPFI